MGVTVDDQSVSILTSNDTATITATSLSQTVTVQPATVNIVTTGTQGPAGISQQEEDLKQDKEFEILDDTPSAGDVTVYEGYYIDPTAATSEAKFRIYKTLVPANGLGAYKRIAEEGSYTTYDQVWDDRASLTY